MKRAPATMFPATLALLLAPAVHATAVPAPDIAEVQLRAINHRVINAFALPDRGFMDKLAAGHGAQADLADIDWLDRLLKNASHCGLGSAAPNPVIDTLQKFRPAYERRLVSLDFEPAFDLDAALAEARQLTARDDPGAHLKTHEEDAR